MFTHLLFDGNDPERITYGGLHARASNFAALLRTLGLQKRPVLLIYPPGPEFAPACFGALRLEAIALDCAPGAVLSTQGVIAKLEERVATDSPLRACPWLATDVDDSPGAFEAERGSGSDLALLQYTSGSTSDPRGVMVTHENLASNVEMIAEAFQLPPGIRNVSWLPHFHDMGLITGLITPLSRGGETILMSPESFLRRPLRWLEAISQYRGQVCGAPNFAYELCVRWADRRSLPSLDLSTWQTAFCGAEPVRASTMRAFADCFRTSGFRTSALTPCYGMAEATVLVSAAPPHKELPLHSLCRAALELGEARPSTEPDALTLVGSGKPAAGTTIRIADPESCLPLGERRVGEVWVSGPQVARGYWGRDDGAFHATLAGTDPSVPGTFLRTGDLGFLTDEGELVFEDRLKDVIVFNGQNYACHDLELTAGMSHGALSPDGCAAVSFGMHGQPRLVVIAELPRRTIAHFEEVAQAIRAAWFTTHGLAARTIAFVPRGKLSRTTSGKLQRRLSASRLEAGALPILAISGDALAEAGSGRGSD
jgi:acyl-CoA synthetase (AMP-forming)/AMP-acid ligase II